jgi:hypothetical protein
MPTHKPITLPLPEKVLKKFRRFVKQDRPSTCWPWQGDCRANFGYGRLFILHKHYLAHRLAYAIAHNTDPGPQCVLHTCDNPPCVNPAHLWLGSRSENSIDRTHKRRSAVGDRNGRHTHPEMIPRGTENPNHKLSEQKVRKIKKLLSHGIPHRTLATRFRVSSKVIWQIRHGKAWGHIQ